MNPWTQFRELERTCQVTYSSWLRGNDLRWTVTLRQRRGQSREVLTADGVDITGAVEALVVVAVEKGWLSPAPPPIPIGPLPGQPAVTVVPRVPQRARQNDLGRRLSR
jgi:hypothetical protein